MGGGGGWEAGGGLHHPTGLFGVTMSPRSASHRPRHDWRALSEGSPTVAQSRTHLLKSYLKSMKSLDFRNLKSRNLYEN